MSPRVIQFLAVLLSAALLLSTTRLSPSIDAGRVTLNMMGETELSRRLPPEYAFFVQAFGAFRGILTNLLFIRAERLKEQGKYFDAVELASLLGKLQPRFVSVWEFLAWNMAWNISVTTYTPEERWYWVYRGVRLLRDEARVYNPKSVNIHRQLAWIFVNKMSETTDEQHMAYKRCWAWHMHLVIGPPPNPIAVTEEEVPLARIKGGVGSEVDILADVADREAKRRAAIKKAQEEAARHGQDQAVQIAIDEGRQRPADTQPAIVFGSFALMVEATRDYLLSIAQAPATLHELYAQHPATREMVAKLRDIRVRIDDDRLGEDRYWEGDGLAVRFFYPYRVLTDPPSMLARILQRGEPDARVAHAEALDAIIGARAKNPDGLALVRFLQRKVLTEVYKLDPHKMAMLVKVFGPMDWRVVDAHSLYWVNEGLVAGEETISTFRNDKVNTLRLIFFSLRNLVQRNRMIFEPHPDIVRVDDAGLLGGDVFKMDISRATRSYLNQGPDLNFILSLQNAYTTYGPQIDPDENDLGSGETFRSGHVNFLAEHIRLLYFSGWVREAAYLYDYLRTTYAMTPDGRPDPQYEQPLEEYVRQTFSEAVVDTGGQIRMIVNALLLASFDELAAGNIADFERKSAQAAKMFVDYNEDLASESRAKMRFPPFPDMQADALRFWVVGYQPPGETSLVRQARMWVACPPYLRLAVYDDLIDYWKEQCEAAGFDVARAFPAPEGLDEYRKAHPRRGPADRDPTIETPVQPFK